MSQVQGTETADANPWVVRSAMIAVVVGMVFGIGVGVYMAWHHEVAVYGGPDAQFALWGCAESEGVSCDVVNTSPWSEVLSVPTFAWAVPTYLATGLAAVQVLLGRRRHVWLVLASGVGISAFSGWLWYISVVELETVCLWCLRLYAINFGTLLLALLAALPLAGLGWPERPTATDLAVVLGTFAVAAGITVGVQQAWRQQLLGDAPDLADLAITAVEVPEDPLDYVDPEGELEPRELMVTTEEGREATLQLRATDAWKGNPDAEVVVVEFADLECGFCKRAATELSQVWKAYGDRVLFVYKHYPLDRACNPGARSRMHRDACNAALAAICAQEQDRFWAYHDLAFKNQHELDPDALTLYAETLDLDVDAWRRCVTSPEAAARLKQSGEDGAALDIGGTPRIWIDGRLYRSGSSARQLAKAVEEALGLKGAEVAARREALGDDDATPVRPIPDDVAPMQTVGEGAGAFRIDTFEAGLDEAGAATSGPGEIPATRMSWYAARDACEAAGKRLCTEAEWISACQGAPAEDDDDDGAFADDMIEGTAYPYGDLHDPRRCWSARHPDEERPVYTAEMPGCVGPDGVYDLVGNVEEWVGASPDQAVLLGGAWDTRGDKARCYRRNDVFGAGYANRRTGFRCCADADAAPAPADTDPPAP
jgi:protein-disulfide isomerase/uncharacterized membrane protein